VTATDIVFPRLQVEEGFRALPYKDSKGLTTVGYGFCVDRGITKRCAAALLREEIAEAHDTLSTYPWYKGLDPARQSVCLDIAINDGLHGLLGFVSMIHFLTLQNWEQAAVECHVSNPELASRYQTLAQVLRTGVTS